MSWIDDLADEPEDQKVNYYERKYKWLDDMLDDPRCPYDLDYIYSWVRASLDRSLDEQVKDITHENRRKDLH